MNKFYLMFEFIKRRYVLKFKTRKALEKYQSQKLKQQFDFFKTHSPYFRDKGFDPLPEMNKAFMMTHFDALNTVGIKKEEAMAIALEAEKTRDFTPKINQISVGLSSGTSGHRGIFLSSDLERAKWAGVVCAKLLPKHRPFPQKIAFFLRSDNNLYQAVGSKLLQYEYFNIADNIKDSVVRLNAYNPSILIAPASMLLVLAKQLILGHLTINPTKIISVAEILEKEDEKYLKEVWQKDYIHQVYQATEGFLACTCEYGNLHLNEDLISFQKRYISEERFYPIITDLERTSQPMINYELNDILIEEKESCPCGSVFTRIKSIEGRSDDIFKFYNRTGEEVLIFPDFIRRCVLFVDGIREYQVIQEKDGSLFILLDDLDDLKKAKLIEEFKLLSQEYAFCLPDIRFGHYDRDKSVKMKRIVSRRLENVNKGGVS